MASQVNTREEEKNAEKQEGRRESESRVLITIITMRIKYKSTWGYYSTEQRAREEWEKRHRRHGHGSSCHSFLHLSPWFILSSLSLSPQTVYITIRILWGVVITIIFVDCVQCEQVPASTYKSYKRQILFSLSLSHVSWDIISF